MLRCLYDCLLQLLIKIFNEYLHLEFVCNRLVLLRGEFLHFEVVDLETILKIKKHFMVFCEKLCLFCVIEI